MDSAAEILSTIVNFSSNIFNSSFGIALIGGCAGAFGGAIGAQRIIERKIKREERIKELRSTNASIMFANSICNTALMMKHDHLLPMQDNYINHKNERQAFMDRLNAGEIDPNESFIAEMNMISVAVPIVPIEPLKSIMFHDISCPGRAIAIIAEVEKALNNLTDALAVRDSFALKFQSGIIPSNLHQYFYFGIPFGNTQLSTEIPDAIKAANSYVDDLAFFSSLLCNDLNQHGKKIVQYIENKGPKSKFNVSEADFSKALEAGLLPPTRKYESWMRGFVEV